MLDEEMTPRAPEGRRRGRVRERHRGPRTSRRAQPREDADLPPRRREVVVHGMRITLPALRFMENHPPPGPRTL